jgi:superfamily II DNA/RNA helicase
LRDKEENVQNDKVQGIILEPTRELAMQVKDQFDKFSSVKSEVVYGGEISSRSQSKSLFFVLSVVN